MGFHTERENRKASAVSPAVPFFQDSVFSAEAGHEGSKSTGSSREQARELADSPEQVSPTPWMMFSHHFGSVSTFSPQGKLAVTQPADPLECEADRIADQVVGITGSENDAG